MAAIAARAVTAVAVVGALAYRSHLDAHSPEANLKRACRGDAAQAGPLIESEIRRVPAQSRRAAAARALDRLRYENS